VDSVVFQLDGNRLSVLLIKRAREPFTGWWALPGGYCAGGETTRAAMARILQDKAGLDTDTLGLVEQLYTFDTVARDPRGHAVSVTYMGLGRDLQLQESSGAQSPQFFPVDALPELAYDHGGIITYALERLRSKLTYTNATYAILPSMFTLTQLQQAYEAVLGRPLDKRNFRKKFLSYNAIEPIGKQYKEGAHRPAMLYQFRGTGLQELERSFD
jgi:8-oxo-dGTP diphosphatase